MTATAINIPITSTHTKTLKLCVIHEGSRNLELPFIRAHVERLPCAVTLVHGFIPAVDDVPMLNQSLVSRASRKARRLALGYGWDREITLAYLSAFRRYRPDAVLAEWGTVAVRVMKACQIHGVPLIAHFHGYDASVFTVLKNYSDAYKELFTHAAALVVVSRDMASRLITMGAPAEKVTYNPSGADCNAFKGARPEMSPPVFVAVGRLVEKKAPYLTLLAFSEVVRQIKTARLRIIGDGPLMGVCRHLADALGISGAVDFLGNQPPQIVRNEMQGARCFVQHSLQASDGDCEGTPIVILEAGATGLPVVSTRHAGIKDVVIEGETGLLVEERDVNGMANAMLRLAVEPELAARMGQLGRKRVEEHFTIDRCIEGLHSIITECVLQRA